MLFDDIAIVYAGTNELSINVDVAMNRLMELRRQYDALAPNWADAPGWAKWYAIDADGTAYWYEKEPQFRKPGTVWKTDAAMQMIESVTIPLGIDWRLCKWQRP